MVRSSSRVRWLAWQGILAILAALSVVAPRAEAVEVTATDLETTITLFPYIMSGLGLEITDHAGAAATELRFRAEGPWEVRVSAGAIHGGPLGHQGGLTVSWAGGTVSAPELTIRPGAQGTDLEVLDGTGRVLFLLDHLDARLDPATGRLILGPSDLRLSRLMAARLGTATLAGTAVGTVEINAVATVRDECTNPNFDLPKDALMIDIEEVLQTVREPGIKVAITPSVSLTNVGEADIEWYGPFSGQHPYLVWTLYRIADDEITQLGLSAVKHSYLSINSDCPCDPGQVLWVGCSDTYNVATNENQYYLGPRHEIEAHTGLWEECGSFFDGDPVDCERDDPGYQNVWDHRLIIEESDLGWGGAEYHFEAFYIIKDDLNIFNTMAHMEVHPTLSAETWTFPIVGPLILGSALDAWVDPSAPPSGSANHTLDTGEGRVRLAVRTEDLGGGLYRYTYALMNHDFDRQVSAFEVPLASGGTVQSTSFTDLDGWAGNDWPAAVTPEGTLRWEAPDPDSGLDWGTLFAFAFDTDMAPVDSYAELTILEAGEPAVLFVRTFAGAEANSIFVDGFESGDTSRWSEP